MQNPAPAIDCDHFAGLTVSQVYKTFGSQVALDGVSFQVARGEIVAVLGPSGCGKSTLLAVIAGLEKPDQGAGMLGRAPRWLTCPPTNAGLA